MIGQIIPRRVKKGTLWACTKVNQLIDSPSSQRCWWWKTYEYKTKYQTRGGERRWEKVLSKILLKCLKCSQFHLLVRMVLSVCNSPGIHHTWKLIQPFSVPQHGWFSVTEIPTLHLCNPRTTILFRNKSYLELNWGGKGHTHTEPPQRKVRHTPFEGISLKKCCEGKHLRSTWWFLI